jgi:phosphate transport system ATP-binding protein
VIVTHNMQQAQRIADETALFMIDGEGQPGRIIEAGPTDLLFGRPQDPRTEAYVNGRFG